MNSIQELSRLGLKKLIRIFNPTGTIKILRVSKKKTRNGKKRRQYGCGQDIPKFIITTNINKLKSYW